MQYGKAFTFAYRKPKTGWKNIWLGGVIALFIPIVGSIVFLGYRGYAASDIDEDPDLEYHRDFKLERFGDYLSKGVWQFLAQLLVVCVMMIAYVGMAIGFVTVGKQGPEMMAVVLLVGYAAVFVFAFLSLLLIWPLELYAALSENVGVGRAFAFAGRFTRMMWGEILIAAIVYFLFAMIASILGYLACCVGIIPAVAIISMAEIHIIVQLYRSYLEKGGPPIRDLDAIHDLSDES